MPGEQSKIRQSATGVLASVSLHWQCKLTNVFNQTKTAQFFSLHLNSCLSFLCFVRELPLVDETISRAEQTPHTTPRNVIVKQHSLNKGNQWHVAEECSLGGETSCWVTQSWVWAPSAERSSTLIMLINHFTPPTFSRTPITIYPHGRRCSANSV